MAKRTDRRATILTAAAACFTRYGYAKTTLDDIGQACQLNKASLYYYFPGKDELFIAVVLQESAAFMLALAERVRHLPTPAAQVRQYLLERLRYYRQVLEQHQVSPAALQVLEPRFDLLYAEVKEREISFLGELLAPLLPESALEPRHLARLLLMAADALKHEAVRQKKLLVAGGLPDLRAAEADTLLLTDLVLAGLAPPPA